MPDPVANSAPPSSSPLAPRAIWQLARDSISAWLDDYAPSMGAAISYYTVFSIAPLMLIVIAMAGFFFGADAASGRVFAELRGFVGEEGAAAIQGLVKSASDGDTLRFGTLIGVATLLVAATTVFAELQSSLDRIWRAPAATAPEGIFALLRGRLLSFGLILAVGFLLLVSLLVSVALAAVARWFAPYLGGQQLVLEVTNFVFSLGIVTVLFAAIYKFLPRVKISWRDVWIGAAVTGVLFTLGKLAIGLYVGRTGTVSAFGAAGSLVIVLLWVYYSAQIFLLGAEFTWIYAYRYGSRRAQVAPPPIVTRGAKGSRSSVSPAP